MQLKNNNRGSSLIEFVLILPILLMLLLGIFGVGYYMNLKQIIIFAASSGAHTASVTNDNKKITDVIIEQLKNFNFDLSKTKITLDPPDASISTRQRGTNITVNITYVLPKPIEFYESSSFTEIKTSVSAVIACVPKKENTPEYSCDSK
jgi:Flp pilus assembly protein TadG